MSQTNNADVQPSTQVIDATSEIIALCKIAGRKDLATDFIEQKLSLADVREKLLTLRAEASEAVNVRSHVAPKVGGAIEAIEQQAQAVAANGGITKQQAFARAIRSNPAAYSEYLRQNPKLDGGKTAESFGN